MMEGERSQHRKITTVPVVMSVKWQALKWSPSVVHFQYFSVTDCHSSLIIRPNCHFATLITQADNVFSVVVGNEGYFHLTKWLMYTSCWRHCKSTTEGCDCHERLTFFHVAPRNCCYFCRWLTPCLAYFCVFFSTYLSVRMAFPFLILPTRLWLAFFFSIIRHQTYLNCWKIWAAIYSPETRMMGLFVSN